MNSRARKIRVAAGTTFAAIAFLAALTQIAPMFGGGIRGTLAAFLIAVVVFAAALVVPVSQGTTQINQQRVGLSEQAPPNGRLGFWEVMEIRRREREAEFRARLTLHGRAIERLKEGKLRPGESVDAEGKMPTASFLGRVLWNPGRFRNRNPPIPVAELPELEAEIERRLREARRFK